MIWLKQKVDARRTEVQKGLPDALDLLVLRRRRLGFTPRGASLTNTRTRCQNHLRRRAGVGPAAAPEARTRGRSSGVEDLHNFIRP